MCAPMAPTVCSRMLSSGKPLVLSGKPLVLSGKAAGVERIVAGLAEFGSEVKAEDPARALVIQLARILARATI